MSWWLLSAVPLTILALAVLPLAGGRMLFPGLTLGLFRRLGSWLFRPLERLHPGLALRLLVRAGNRHFRRAFAATPFGRRLLFLPYCLRPAACPAPIDPALGLACDSSCPGCDLGLCRAHALSLGYAAVYVVPSSRLVRDRNLKPSAQFIRDKLDSHCPGAALGVTCDWHLKHRLLPAYKVGRRGYQSGPNQSEAALQGVLLDSKNCRAACVDWSRLRERIALSS